MIAVPALLVYFAFFALALFVLVACTVLYFAARLLISLHRLSSLALRGVEEARERLAYVRDLITLNW